jgi:hypothetical protein
MNYQILAEELFFKKQFIGWENIWALPSAHSYDCISEVGYC